MLSAQSHQKLLPGPYLAFADVEFEELRRELRVRGSVVDLETKCWEVLHELVLHAGEVVTKDELLDSVWPGLTELCELLRSYDSGADEALFSLDDFMCKAIREVSRVEKIEMARHSDLMTFGISNDGRLEQMSFRGILPT